MNSIRKTEPPAPTPKIGHADAKGVLALGARPAIKVCLMTVQQDGRLLLDPLVAVHERSVWFYRPPKAQAVVQERIQRSRRGQTVGLGS